MVDFSISKTNSIFRIFTLKTIEDKMHSIEGHVKSKKRRYQMPFLYEVGGSSVKKIKFRNSDVYGEKNALKKFIHFNIIRNQNELDENFEMLE